MFKRLLATALAFTLLAACDSSGTDSGYRCRVYGEDCAYTPEHEQYYDDGGYDVHNHYYYDSSSETSTYGKPYPSAKYRTRSSAPKYRSTATTSRSSVSSPTRSTTSSSSRSSGSSRK